MTNVTSQEKPALTPPAVSPAGSRRPSRDAFCFTTVATRQLSPPKRVDEEPAVSGVDLPFGEGSACRPPTALAPAAVSSPRTSGDHSLAVTSDPALEGGSPPQPHSSRYPDPCHPTKECWPFQNHQPDRHGSHRGRCLAADREIETLEEGHFASSVPDIALPEFPRSHNTPQEIVAILAGLGYKKCSTDVLKTFLLSVMAGFWVALAGILATSVAGGVPEDVRVTWPSLPRTLAATVFPVGIIFEVLFGGELFTGNNMILFVSWYSGKISKLAVAGNWAVVWLGNLAGSLSTLVMFAWLPGLFDDVPFRGFAVAAAEMRGALSHDAIFLRGVLANILVCLSIYLGLMARDVFGKAFGMYIPIFVFVATAMEHCVADMYFVPMGMLLGAKVDVAACVLFLLTCTAGNIVGGALLVGGSLWYMHGREVSSVVEAAKFDEK